MWWFRPPLVVEICRIYPSARMGTSGRYPVARKTVDFDLKVISMNVNVMILDVYVQKQSTTGGLRYSPCFPCGLLGGRTSRDLLRYGRGRRFAACVRHVAVI